MENITNKVTVLDGDGNIIGETYPKRAKGLIKAGRARYIDEATVCLTPTAPCPRNDTEVNMNDNKNINSSETKELNMSYLLSRIEEIAAQNEQLLSAVKQIVEVVPDSPAGMEQAKAIADAVKSREETNLRLLALYEKMYSDLEKNEFRMKALNIISNFEHMEEFQTTAVTDALDTLRHS